MSRISAAEAELDRLYRELEELQFRMAHADDAEQQELENPICQIELDIEEIENDLAGAEEAELRSDYYAERL